MNRHYTEIAEDYWNREYLDYSDRVYNLIELEIILTKLVNEFEYGYGFIKNSRELLEKLVEYKSNNQTKLKVTVIQSNNV